MADQLHYGVTAAEWPFPIKYGEETRVETDVLIVGAGIAGAMAGIKAARRGVKVAVVDKAPIDISGNGGAGLDHYGGCVSNPDCAFTPEEFMDFGVPSKYESRSVDHRIYITMKESWDNILELEKLGMRFRDEDDEFVGAPFRDDKTKIMYAYDYKNRNTIRMRSGADIKKYAKEGLLKEPNATLFERVMITNLLTEGGKQGARVVGATGLNEETGEFYVFSAKSIVLSTGGVTGTSVGTWIFNSEMYGNGYRHDPRCSGEGPAAAWKAGAQFHSEEQFGQDLWGSPFGWIWYGIGNPDNTWHVVPLVDNKGTVLPWVDAADKPIYTIEERTLPADGQQYMATIRPTVYIDPELIRNGTYELPLWADLTVLSDDERRGVWGLMVGNEGRTRTALYAHYNEAGFNPDTDLLQCPVMTPESFGEHRKDWFQGEPKTVQQSKVDTLKGVSVDWNQMTSIEGLFAAGTESGQGSATAGSSGGYAGNRAAEYAMKAELGVIDEAQLKAEKERVYAPVKRFGEEDAVISWKELHMGINRVMQQDCGDFRTLALCDHGLMWLDSIKKFEMQKTYARNPHELVRVLETESKITIAEIYLYLCKANFLREAAGIAPDKKMYNKLIDGELITTYRENEWWLKPPYLPTYKENYDTIKAAEQEGN